MEEEEGAIFRKPACAVRISLFFVSEKRRSGARVKLKEIVESRTGGLALLCLGGSVL